MTLGYGMSVLIAMHNVNEIVRYQALNVFNQVYQGWKRAVFVHYLCCTHYGCSNVAELSHVSTYFRVTCS